jgi:hypothetical protein
MAPSGARPRMSDLRQQLGLDVAEVALDVRLGHSEREQRD